MKFKRKGMRNPILGIAGLVIVLTYISCSNIRLKIIDDIQDNPEMYENLVATIGKCDFTGFEDNQYIASDYFPQALLDAIDRTPLKNRVNYLVLNRHQNCELQSVELISGNMQIVYNPCPDSDFPKPGSYEKSGFIETWGISPNWYVWKDNDFQ